MPENSSGVLLRAKTIYIYMGNYAKVSRSSRMQWLMDHLDSVVTLPVIENVENIRKAMEIVSIVPEEQVGVNWSAEACHSFQYYVHPRTQLYFLSRQYCLTYCLDLSPSMSAVETQNGQVLLDKVFTSLKTSLEGVCQSFIIPGSQLVFYPEIYISIIVNTPFFTTPAQQVLVQSWKVTCQNLPELCKAVSAGLARLETAVAHVAHIAEPEPTMVRPDQGFINMIRFGMLALRLLPIASVSGIVVVTDGVITLPDAWLLEATISRLRSSGVSCHFLHVGARFHPHMAYGRVPYSDLMTFLSAASMGTLFMSVKEASILDFRDLQINPFHRGFLLWSFQDLNHNESTYEDLPQTFRMELLRKKQVEESLSVSLIKVLCCRIREGYVFSNMSLSDSQVEITLNLLWKHNAYIEYAIVSKWPANSHKVHYTLHVRAAYEFLHDITCGKNRFQSPFRQALVTRFWTTMKNIAQSDYLLVHLHSKESNTSWNVLSESIKSGMPLFYLSSGGNLTTNDVSNPQFAMYWKPISLLDPEQWHRWLHVSRIGLLLRHDCPLPKHLHLRNSSGRFQSVQCRQAATAMQTLLRDMATFVLVENQTFVKLDESTFYIVRVTGKPPCVVLHVAFPCGVPEERRAEVVLCLRACLQELSCPWRASPHTRRRQPASRTFSRVSCCLVLQKPVEKILVRYERAPTTFQTVVFPDGTQPSLSAKAPDRPGYLVTTLSRYLHHKRYIWEASVGATPLARIVSTLTRLRLQEGFSFAHSQAGVVTMLLEAEAGEGEDADTSRCVVQYVLFPPHSDSEDEETPGCLVTESWVEPHSGLLRGLPYHKLGAAIAATDSVCISAMLTFEHLSLMSRDRSVELPARSRTLHKDTPFQTPTAPTPNQTTQITPDGNKTQLTNTYKTPLTNKIRPIEDISPILSVPAYKTPVTNSNDAKTTLTNATVFRIQTANSNSADVATTNGVAVAALPSAGIGHIAHSTSKNSASDVTTSNDSENNKTALFNSSPLNKTQLLTSANNIQGDPLKLSLLSKTPSSASVNGLNKDDSFVLTHSNMTKEPAEETQNKILPTSINNVAPIASTPIKTHNPHRAKLDITSTSSVTTSATPLLHMEITEQEPRINTVPLQFDVVQLLPQCRQAELLFLMPVQDWPVTSKVIDTNFTLMELIGEILGNLNDRDILFTEEESLRFVEHLHRRERDADSTPLAVPKPEPGKTPRWRIFVKSFSPTHLYLTVIPATYADLKILNDSEELTKDDGAESESWPQRREASRSISIEPQPSLDSLSDLGSRTQSLRKDTVDENSTYVTALQTSLDSLINPPENNLRVFNNLPKPFRLRASSLDTNLERSRRAARMLLEAKNGGNRTASLEAKQVAALEVASCPSQASETDALDSKSFATIPLPIFIYDCPLHSLIDSLLYKDFKSNSEESK